MADRSILYRLRAAIQGAFVAVDSEVESTENHVGVLAGVNNIGTALARLDATGIGAQIFRFTGNYTAQSSNISEWFGGRQVNRLRCTSNGGISPVILTLPGSTALNTAFDQLVAAGVPEVIRFVVEYTGDTTFLRVVARTGGPVIQNTSAVIVRPGIAATIEVTRENSVISSYLFDAIGGLDEVGGSAFDAVKLINPAVATWDASSNGVLPSSGVIKGNAYRVVNAPSDGSGRFGEFMQNGDWVVWEGETFTAWSTSPHAWFVLPAHEVRRISALSSDFLTTISETPEGRRNTVVRNEDYATDSTHGEIRLKLYPTRGDYSAADINTTGDIDVYTDPASQTAYLAIRLAGTASSLADVLPTLYVYSEDSGGNFERLLHLSADFTHEGDFGDESDYLSLEPIDYGANDSLRVYIGTAEGRYHTPDLDIFEPNLSDPLQGKINSRESWASIAEVFFSGATVRDVHVADRIEYATGYSRGIDWRDMANSTTVNASRYIDGDLSITSNNAAFTITGFGAGLRKLILVQLQRNDAQTGDGAMIEIANGVAFIRVNSSNQIQVNTTPGSGSESWSSFDDGSLTPVALGAGSDNFLILEVLPTGGTSTDRYEIVPVFYNGTTYDQLNNLEFTASGSVNGDDLGFSRSTSQRGQVLRFSAIRSSGYLTHSALESLLRHHVNDRWNLGFARLYEGGTSKEVIFQTRIGLEASPNGTEVVLVADDTDTNNIKLEVENA